jgi:inner membrane protein
MQSNVTLKAAILIGLTLVFAVVLISIGGVISERERYRAQVLEDVARSTARSQSVLGPLLVVPYRERVEVVRPNATTRTWEDVTGQSILTPDSLTCRTSIHVETRTRGIYRAPVYRATVHLSGTFRVPARLGIAAARAVSPGDPASLVLSVSDMRGLRRPPQVRLRGETVATVPGTGVGSLGPGLSAGAGQLFGDEATTVPFEVDFEVLGTDRIGIVPVGAGTHVTMESDWPHPDFTGGFLPDTRTVTAKGFNASWELSQYATGIRDAIGKEVNRETLNGYEVAVRFVEPVDVYRQSERATKYGILFVLLTFVAFFLFEVLRRLAVHPIQYALAGAAVALFFLLLLSLSEYVAFPMAYLIASCACVGLLAFYVGHVLGSAARGAVFAALLACLYGVLYLLLQSEDYALLLGSLLLFAVLATVMVVTRRINWYRMGEGETR